MITVKNLKKQFGDNVVLDGIDVHVDQGEVLAIIGPSGSGKSTFLRCLNLLEKPDEGLIQIADTKVDVKKMNAKEMHQLRQKTAMVFQHYNLFKNKTALENVTESLIIAKKMKRQEAEDIGKELLVKVGLKDQFYQYPVTLSGGQQQRVGIARALAVKPRAILFDEPTSALDPEWVSEVLQVIKDIAQLKTTMIIVTHEMQFAEEVADRVIFMADGSIVEQNNPKEMFNRPQSPRTQQFLNKIGTGELND
ncbi:amino acid ABC transporter ATP-binding protein (PAAT family) [Scopulibacillus darangshiensis]|uniref:Amino acid ABC transporter ATP-binding protein (PAAT family) n=1 Tax=Scopulibacillus darangshiensis TaxID=442528 RepID=A0A4R2NR07_9BACL|nr:amino acid ABC transporter ATP-binding protein [Scopulibacillus darangshiensis]TCP23765.1 amino acid ABC transporter ATP-binding protein (PAAT family) [Scopulibacillus darangshiensis]